MFVCGKGIAGLNVSSYFSSQPPNSLSSDNGENSVKKTFGIVSVKTGNLEELNTSILEFLKDCLNLDKTSFTNFIQTLCQSVNVAGGKLYITGSVDEVLQVLNSDMSEEKKIQYLKNTPFPGDFDLSIVFDSKDKIKKICQSLNHPLRRTLFDQYGITDRPIKEEEIEKGFVILRSRNNHSTKLPLEIKITTYDGLDTGIPELNHRTEIRCCENENQYEQCAVTDFINSVNDRNFNISQEHVFKNLMLWRRILRLWMNNYTMKNKKPTQIFFENIAEHAKERIKRIKEQSTEKNSDITQYINYACLDDVSTIFSKEFLLTKKTIHQTLHPSIRTLESKIKYWKERRKTIENLIDLINKLKDTHKPFVKTEKMNDVDVININLYVNTFKEKLIESLASQKTQLDIQIEKLKHELTETSHTPDALSDTQTVSHSEVQVDIPFAQKNWELEKNSEKKLMDTKPIICNTDQPPVEPTEEKKDSVERDGVEQNKGIKTKKKTRKKPRKDKDKIHKDGVMTKWEKFFNSNDRQIIYDDNSKTNIPFEEYNPTGDITTLLSINEYPIAMNILNAYLNSNLTAEIKVKIITEALFANKIEGDQSDYSESNFSVLFREYLKTGENKEFMDILIPSLKEAMSPPKQQPQAKRKSKSTPNKPGAIIDKKKLIEELKQSYNSIKSENGDSNSRSLDVLFYLFIKELFEPTILEDLDLPILKMIFQLQKHDDKDFEWIEIIPHKPVAMEKELNNFFSSELNDFFSNTQNQSIEDFCCLLDSAFSALKEDKLSHSLKRKIQILTFQILTTFIKLATYEIILLISGDKYSPPKDPIETQDPIDPQLPKVRSIYNRINLYLSPEYFILILPLQDQNEINLNTQYHILCDTFSCLKNTLSLSEDAMKKLPPKGSMEKKDKVKDTIQIRQLDKKGKEEMLKMYIGTLSFLATLKPQQTHKGKQFQLHISIHALLEILVLCTSTDNNHIEIQQKIIEFLKNINCIDIDTKNAIKKIIQIFYAHVSNMRIPQEEVRDINTFLSNINDLGQLTNHSSIQRKITSL